MLKAEINAIKFYDRAIEQVKEKDYPEALSFLDKAIKKYENNPLFYYVKGYIYHEMGDLSRAKEFYLQTLELDFTHVECIWNLSMVFLLQSNMTEAMKYWQILLDLDPNDSDSRLNLALAYFNAEEFNMAVDELNELLKNDPDHFEASKNLALILKQQKKYQQSIELLVRLPELDQTYEGAVEKELIKVEALKFKESLREMEANNYGNILGSMSSSGDEDSSFESLLEQAFGASIEGDYPQALEKAYLALKLNDQDFMPYQIIYQANLALENLDEAEVAITKAIEFEPKNAELVNDLANLHMHRKEYVKALEEFKKVKELNSIFPFIDENIILAKDSLGEEW